MIQYNEIIEQLKDEDIFNLLEQLGGEPIDKEDYILSRTICHNSVDEDSSHKLYYYKNTHIFMCYTECGAQNIFSFLKHYYEANNIIYDWYNDIYKVILNCSEFNPQYRKISTYKSIKNKYDLKKVRRDLPEFEKGVLQLFSHKYPIEWLNDGITKEAMDKYEIKYSISNNKIIIPHFDKNKRLVGIRGRALNKEDEELFGKYAPIQIEGKWYSHPLSLNLYGLDKTWENIKRSGVCYIGEGEKFCLQNESFNSDLLNCSVASCGSNLNKYQIDLLMRYCKPKEIIICFDNEENEGSKYFEKLYQICLKYKVYCDMSFVYDRDNLTNYKDSPTDRGLDIYKKLLENRVKV